MTSKKYYGHHPLTDDERDSRRQNVVETIKLTVSEEWAGSRIDMFLSDRLEKTRSSVQKLVTQGNVSVDGSMNRKPSAKVFPGQEVSVDIPEPEFLSIVPEPVDFHVVYKDEHIIVVDKPAGVVVHPAPGHWTGTLVHGLLHRFPEIGELNGAIRPGIVHRLDATTSGLMVVARNDFSHERLARAFQERLVEKEYLALVWGAPRKTEGTVQLPIGRDRRNRYRMAVTPGGKRAVTQYRVLWSRGQYSLVSCAIMTGRTHQIRVHLKSIGAPLVGDSLYAPRKKEIPRMERVFLHSWKMSFPHPESGAVISFRSFLPDDLTRFLTCFLSTVREKQ